ncbi:MAG TPA: flavodoxin domain-containing protein [Clostridia bacterium]|nr:flavodoxin domain-containing protein [Clostridia bacterium]
MEGIIIYATKYGCTKKAAGLLREKLQEKLQSGMKAVDIGKEKAPDLSAYDVVILGGPIYVGKTLKPLADYMQKNLEVLKRKRLALFLCAGEQDPGQKELLLAGAFPEELRKIAVACEVFGGELNWDKLDFMTRLILRLVKGIKTGYYRLSQEKIEKFALDVSKAGVLK